MSEAELQRAKADRAAVAQTLQRLNGGAPITMPDTVYPATTALPPLATLKEAMPHTAAMAQAEASLAQSTAAVKLAKVEGMPEFTVGFQGEYIKDNNYSGPSIGLSIPLWGNTRRKVKAARATQVASQLSLADARQQQLSTLDQLYMQATDLNATTQQLKTTLPLQPTMPSCVARWRQDSCRCSIIFLNSRSTIRLAQHCLRPNAMHNWLCRRCER